MPSASDLQKNFGLWHERLHKGPVEVTRYGRTTAYLVSAEQFQDLWSCYRRVVDAGTLSDGEMAAILASEVATDAPFELEDLSDEDHQNPVRR